MCIHSFYHKRWGSEDSFDDDDDAAAAAVETILFGSEL